MSSSLTRQILFVGHDASRSGAPLLLLYLLRWLKQHTSFSFQVLLGQGGELLTEFEALTTVTIFQREFPLKTDMLSKTMRHFGWQRNQKQRHLNDIREKFQYDNVGVIYCNSIAAAKIVQALDKHSCPLICHVHELEYAIQYYGIQHFENMKRHVHQYIAASDAVKQNLISRHHIAEANIRVIYEYLPSMLPEVSSDNDAKRQICQELRISENALIVCAVGTIDWRKGADLFIQLARIIHTTHIDISIHFLWVGRENGMTQHQLAHDLGLLELNDYVHFIGERPDALHYLAGSEVFVLMSREDPFPLVCLEAASQGKPIVCFDKAGGAKEFVEEDAGVVVPYLDIERMAEKVVTLLLSPELRQTLGQQARKKVWARHHIEQAAPQIIEMIAHIGHH